MAFKTHTKEQSGAFIRAVGTAMNDLDFPAVARRDKAFSALCAAFALRGYAFYRTDFRDGQVLYLATRLGQVRTVPTLDDAGQLLAEVGGQQ